MLPKWMKSKLCSLALKPPDIQLYLSKKYYYSWFSKTLWKIAFFEKWVYKLGLVNKKQVFIKILHCWLVCFLCSCKGEMLVQLEWAMKIPGNLTLESYEHLSSLSFKKKNYLKKAFLAEFKRLNLDNLHVQRSTLWFIVSSKYFFFVIKFTNGLSFHFE